MLTVIAPLSQLLCMWEGMTLGNRQTVGATTCPEDQTIAHHRGVMSLNKQRVLCT